MPMAAGEGVNVQLGQSANALPRFSRISREQGIGTRELPHASIHGVTRYERPGFLIVERAGTGSMALGLDDFPGTRRIDSLVLLHELNLRHRLESEKNPIENETEARTHDSAAARHRLLSLENFRIVGMDQDVLNAELPIPCGIPQMVRVVMGDHDLGDLFRIEAAALNLPNIFVELSRRTGIYHEQISIRIDEVGIHEPARFEEPKSGNNFLQMSFASSLGLGIV